MTLFDRYFAGERIRLTDEVRATLPGRFVHLSQGNTHYEIQGPEEGRFVVLVHGFSVPKFIWDPTFAALAQAGFRVLRYDLYGRGYSERPLVANTKALFVRQLGELLEALSISSQISIVSLSMGGPIAAAFAQRYPERVRDLAFVDPAGFDLGLPLTARLLHAPLLGELMLGVLGRFGHRSLQEGMISDFYQPTQEALDAFVPRYLEQMKYQGFKRSLLSTMRKGLLNKDFGGYRALGKSGKPVLLVWGREDQTVPFRHHEQFQKLVPQTQFHVIEQAGHIPHFERPDVVNPLLIQFLSR